MAQLPIVSLTLIQTGRRCQTGPVILQDVFHIRVGADQLDEVKERGQSLEGKVLSKAVQLFLNDELVVKDKKVIFRPGRHPGTRPARPDLV